MGTLTITEFDRLGEGEGGEKVSAAELSEQVSTQTVSTSGTSAQSTTLDTCTCLVRVVSDTAVAIRAGVNPTAVTTDMPLQANKEEYFTVNGRTKGGLKIAVIDT